MNDANLSAELRIKPGTEWSGLDRAAKCNLNYHEMAAFNEYKQRLIDDGHKWDDAEDILRGFIWSCLE